MIDLCFQVRVCPVYSPGTPEGCRADPLADRHASNRGRSCLRKPNYNFERSQRVKAKEEKAKEKAARKQEKAAPDAGSAVGPEDEARGGHEAPGGPGPTVRNDGN